MASVILFTLRALCVSVALRHGLQRQDNTAHTHTHTHCCMATDAGRTTFCCISCCACCYALLAMLHARNCVFTATLSISPDWIVCTVQPLNSPVVGYKQFVQNYEDITRYNVIVQRTSGREQKASPVIIIIIIIIIKILFTHATKHRLAHISSM